jgi:ATP-binding cassette, subfamily B, bacterial
LDTRALIADAADAVPAPPFAGRVTFEQVSFDYAAERPALRGIDLDILPGTRVAVVGPSGSGKSTLVSLLPRLYDPDAGRILFDGHDIRRYTLSSLRSQISVVPQEGMLFGVSVRENIAYGVLANADVAANGDSSPREAKPDDTLSPVPVSDQAIEAAARLANAHDFIMKLPQGYDTVLSEGGATLSGGQRQRLAVARAALRKAPIIILDEPTTGLDDANARAVHLALERLADGRTSFWVTHDLPTAQQADLILYLENGRIVEQGTHDRLMQHQGRYAESYRQAVQVDPDAEQHAAWSSPIRSANNGTFAAPVCARNM